MRFKLHFDRPAIDINKLFPPAGVTGIVMRWLTEQNEPPGVVFGPMEESDRRYTELHIMVEVDEWKLQSLWDRIGHIEKVERLPDLEDSAADPLC